MKNAFLVLIGGLLLALPQARAQLPAYYEPYRVYQDAVDLFDKELYSPANKKFEEYLNYAGYGKWQLDNERNANARFYKAVCAYHLDHLDTEAQFRDFVDHFPQNSKWILAQYYFGMYYFNKSKHAESVEPFLICFKQGDLGPARNQEIPFRLAYAYYLSDQFDKAKDYFAVTMSETGNPYAVDAEYYRSLILYQEGEYNLAYDAFTTLRSKDNDNKYTDEIRMYEANVLLKLKKYDELYELANELAVDPDVQEEDAQVYFIVANASFEKDDYPRSNEYFGRYVKAGEKLNRTSNYRYAHTYYKQQKYEEAIPLYTKVLEQKWDSLTQIASYYLGFCFMETGNKDNARVAFEKTAFAKNPGNELIHQDALYQYGKLSFSTRHYEESLKGLRTLEKSYPEFEKIDEVQSLIGDVLLYSKNYKQAISYLESLPNQNASARKSYQTACFFYGTRLFDKGKFVEAAEYFDKAVSNNYDKELGLTAQYWRGEALFREEKYDEAIKAFQGFSSLPGASSHEYAQMANYGKGWSYFKLKQYSASVKEFDKFIKASSASTESRYLVDAYLRAGDCQFLKRSYSAAEGYYRKVIDFNYTYVDYAIYQIAESQYRQGNYQTSTSTFGRLVNQFRKSELRDDALDRMSDIYITWVKDYAQAQKYAGQLVKEYPRSPLAPAAYNRLAVAAYYSDDEAGAIKNFKKVLKDYGYDQENSQIALENLSSLLSPQEYDKVFKDYKASNPDLNENLASLYFNTGMDRYYGGSYRSAIEQFKSYINDFPNGPNYHESLLYKARSHKALGETESALSDYGKVFSTKPKNNFTNVALLEAADLKFAEDNYSSALELFRLLEEEAEKVENKAEARFGMAKCHLGLKEYSLAEQVLLPVVNNPQLNTDVRDKAKTQVGYSRFKQDRLNDAKSILQEVVKSDQGENGAQSQYLITQILHDQGKYTEAKEAGLYLQNNFPTLNYWKAKALIVVARSDYALGDTFQAKGVLESIIANGEFTDITIEAQTFLDEINAKEAAEDPNTITLPEGDGGSK